MGLRRAGPPQSDEGRGGSPKTSKTILTSRQSYWHGVGHRGLAKGEQGPGALKNAEIGDEGIANGSRQHVDGRIAAKPRTNPKGHYSTYFSGSSKP